MGRMWRYCLVAVSIVLTLPTPPALGQVNVNVGTLPAGKSVTITFNAQINSPLPPGTTQISQQGTLTGANFAPVLSDDPTTTIANDPTLTAIGSAVGGGGPGGPPVAVIPTLSQWGALLLALLLLGVGGRRLYVNSQARRWLWMFVLLGGVGTTLVVAQQTTPTVTLTDQVLSDRNANGRIDGGDRLRYTARIANPGPDDLMNVVFALTLDPNTTLIAGSLNTSPIALNQTIFVTLNTPQTVTLTGSDAEGDPLTFQITRFPIRGQLAGTPPNLTYTPQSGFTGTDEMRFRVNDGTASSNEEGIVTLTVSDDTPPVAVADTATVNEDAGATVIDVLTNDTDPDGGAKSIQAVTQPTNGAVVITGGGTGLTYQPNANYCNSPPGTTLDTFTYTLNGGSVATVTVTVTCVDDQPTAVSDSATVNEDDPATAINVLANDTDPEGDAMTIASVTQPGNGTVVITGGGTGLTYQPTANYCNSPPGTTLDTFTYTLNGGSVATVSMTVTCGDDPPTAVDDAATVAEDSGANAIDVLANDTDPEGDAITVASVTQPTNGTVVITGGGTGLTYQPNANYCNSPPGTTLDTFTYTLMPGNATATVTVTVNCVDNPPVAVNDSATVGEDAPATAVDVLANDTDPDGGAKSVASVTQPGNGVVVITGGGTGLTYQPNADYCNSPPGTTLDTFTYTLNGGSVGTVTMTVTCVDDDPTAVNDAATVAEDSGANAIAVLTNDTDPDGGPKSIQSVTQPANGTVVITGGGTGLTYQPTGNYCNNPPGITLDTFSYTITPGGSTATVTVTVTCVDDPPVAVTDTATVAEDAVATAISVLANDLDIDAGPIGIFSVTQPANGTVAITGGGTGLTYQPDADYCNDLSGTPDTFSYTLAPGGSTAAVSVTVTCVNDAPVAQDKSGIAIQANMKRNGIDAGLLTGVTDADAGIDGCVPTFAVASITANSGGTVSNVNLGAGTFDFEPDAGFTGTAVVNYTVDDDGCPSSAISAVATISLTVNGPVIWFVNTAAAPGGNGTLSQPFQTLASVPGVDNANDRVFVFTGTYTNGLALLSGEWLIGQGVTGVDFDTVFGITPPAGTIARPAINGTRPTLQNTVTLETNSRVQGLNLSTGGTVGMTDPAGAITGVTVSEVSVATTTGTAVNLSNLGGTLSFTSISANGGANGIVWNNASATTGSFTVTGVGTTDGSGGTIQNTINRGASFINASNITLTNMNFTNAGTSDLDADNSGLSTGDNLATNAAIHLQSVTTATLDNLNISGGAEQGINGNTVSNFTLSNSTITDVGNAADEDGIHFFNMSGTSAITNTTLNCTVVTPNTTGGDDHLNLQTQSGTLNLTITGGSATNANKGSGYLFGIRGTSNATITFTNANSSNNFSGGIVADAFDSAVMDLNVTNSTSSSNNDQLSVSAGDNSSVDLVATGNTLSSPNAADFVVVSLLGSAFDTGYTLDANISGNSITVGNGRTADAIVIFSAGGGAIRTTITNNIIDYAGTQRAILAQAGQDGSGSTDLTITGNTIDIELDGAGNAVAGILAQTAITGPGNTSSLCADIGGAGGLSNTFTHSLGGTMAGGDIRVRQRNDGTVRLPGYGGGATDTAAVIAYLNGRNVEVSSSTATADSSGFAGGAACTQPSL